MRRLHIPFTLLLALYLVAHFGRRLREGVSNFTEVTRAQGRATGIHYAPAENLERLDVAALRSTHHTLDICMYATDRYLAEAVAEVASHGVAIRIYRDGSQYEEEEQHGRGRSAMDLLRGLKNVQIRVKPPSRRTLMHLKAYDTDGTLLRGEEEEGEEEECDRNNNLAAVGTINWPQGRWKGFVFSGADRGSSRPLEP